MHLVKAQLYQQRIPKINLVLINISIRRRLKLLICIFSLCFIKQSQNRSMEDLKEEF